MPASRCRSRQRERNHMQTGLLPNRMICSRPLMHTTSCPLLVRVDLCVRLTRA
ncbi:MAG: hypothetical protein KHX25_04125 [Firmicutes bacterium]|nr:hypothetical protein [Bacillota bacterium]